MKKKQFSLISFLLLSVLLITACGNDQTPATLPETGTPAASVSPEAAEPTEAVGNTLPSVTPAVLTLPVDATPTPGADGTPDVTPDASVPTGTGTSAPTEGGTLQPASPAVSEAGKATPAPSGNKTPTKGGSKPTAAPEPTKGSGKPTNTPKPTKAPAKDTPTPIPTKKPGNTSTPSPTPTPEPIVWDEPWEDAVCRDDIAAALMAKVNAYRASKGVPVYENPYDYEDIKPGLGDRLTEKAHRVAKANALLGSKSQSKHEGGQIGTGIVYWRSSTDAEVVEEISGELFTTWYNSKAHNANMLDDWSPSIGVAVMAVYEYYDGIFYYYAAIMGVSSTSIPK